jgi:LIVCS family branched-chain amino acid:cation transporter
MFINNYLNHYQQTIDHFRGAYAFLSNFYPSRIYYRGYWYANNEAAFQAQKTCLPKEKLRFTRLKNPKDVAYGTLKAGIVVLILMGIIYSFLAYIGACSLGQFALSANGGIALAQISTYYFGSFGHILLALTVTIACLKTSIGLITACSTTFSELYPNSFSYRTYAFIFTIVSFLIANVGLTSIIFLAIPILMLLYPLAITLIILAFISAIFGYHRYVYSVTTLFTLFAAIGDMLNALPFGLNNTATISAIIEVYKNTLPFFDMGMGWIVPSIIGLIIGVIISLIKKD